MNQKPNESVIGRSPSGVGVMTFPDASAARAYMNKHKEAGRPAPNLTFYQQVITETEIKL